LTRRARNPDETVEAFARRHFGRRVTSVLVDAMQAGIYAGDPSRLSVRSAFPQIAALDARHRSLLWGFLKERRGSRQARGGLCTFAGGLQTLTDSLARSLQSALRCEARVTSVRRTDNGWRVSLEQRGTQAELDTDAVVVATPAHVAARLLQPLSDELATDLSRIGYAPLAAVHLGYARASLSPPAGFGFLVPDEEQRSTLGVMYISSFFPFRSEPDRFLFTCMLGGVRRPGLLEQSDAELGRIAWTELGAALGLRAEPLYQRVVRWPRGIPQYVVGHSRLLEAVDQQLARLPGLSLTGNSYRGVGVNDCIRNAAELSRRVLLPASKPFGV
jgi:protoporphyrinogen/coproporphyrinogen III oxidase